MKRGLSMMARAGCVAALLLLCSQRASASEFLFMVPVQINNPDPSWERASVTCVVTGVAENVRVASGTIYIDLPGHGNVNTSYYVQANLLPGALVADAKKWSCHIRIKPKDSPGFPPMSRTTHDTGRSRTVVTGRF